ncbi:UNVERIFIED_CONTAM: hypothetical protein Q9R58_26040 [Methylobacteriaceae bacterium AG10]|jgi:hypothetical protein|nr:hypothetical protein [Methylobacteriaceae bacterium AG10]
MLATTPTSPHRTRLGSLLAGLSALASLWPSSTAPLRYPHRDEAEALLGDGLRIGDDLRVVIERERARAQAAAN